VTGSSLHVTAAARSFADQDPAFNPVWSQLFTNLKDGVGNVRVEVEDAQGKVIPGFSADECKPLRGRSLSQPVTWKDGKDLRALHGQSVRFKFVISNAKLFSYSLE
jgi:hypothetical protein